MIINSFVYCWTNHTLQKIYIGFHKGTEDDKYVCSSRSEQFWSDFNNTEYKWSRQIIAKGTMKDCQVLESAILDSIDITSEYVYNNKNNLMFNLNDEVRDKLKAAAKKRNTNPNYIAVLSQKTKKQWDDPKFHEYMSKINTGKKLSEETKDKLREIRKNQVFSKESIEKAANSNRGKKRSEETKQKFKEISKNRPRVCCIFCRKEGVKPSMVRYHLDNCKEKK
jgi:predicted transcriptional regulator